MMSCCDGDDVMHGNESSVANLCYYLVTFPSWLMGLGQGVFLPRYWTVPFAALTTMQTCVAYRVL